MMAPVMAAAMASVVAHGMPPVMRLVMAFPQQAPFRVDQVMAAPALMTALWLVLLLLAVVLSWAGHTGRPRAWWCGAGLLLVVVALFFTLASWGTSDITKLSHYFANAPERLPKAEPLWPLLTPLVLAMPYRMAALHGLVAAGYAALPLLLSRSWRLGAWGGWWALLIVCSPLLRSFLQNGITRQALAVLLLAPLMLWGSGLLGRRRRLVFGSTVVAAISHTTFPISLLAALVPSLVRLRPGAAWARLSGWWHQRLAGSGAGRGWRLAGLALGVLLVGTVLANVLPMALLKFQLYSQRETFFSSYPILPDVLRLELALLVAVGLVVWRRGRNPGPLLRQEGLARQLLLYAAALLLIQVSVATAWLAPITFRLADLVGLYLLLSFLAWIREQGAAWAVLPPLAVTLAGWLQHRLLDVAALRCGLDDNFLCIPDRLPWLIQY
ncbi:MAG: hypothetical protein VKN56_12350 [Cyanobacteriota bacterium]|nr:hypothetical protein [Cyanobacteriota bacterium]